MKKRGFRLLAAAVLLAALSVPVRGADMLIPVGRVVGLEIRDGSVTVAAFEENSPAREAGVEVGDRLVAIDGGAVSSNQDVRQLLQRSKGSVRLTLCRDGRQREVRVEPAITRDGPKLGVYLRQGVTGIGTVTYFDPRTASFGALGHGVNDPKGEPVAMRRGSAYPARVVSVRKGVAGEPGQLMGALTQRSPLGELEKNVAQGVFGKTDIPWTGEALPVAGCEEVRAGKAVILSTVQGETPREYSVEILKIYPSPRQSGRNMLLRVTDPALLETTGGIVQGMSGSPIIQDGKLIGAVTHVLVNDPTTGYGIFIENMLEAAS